MTMPVLVAVADDFSGASDQAGMLARAGAASLLVLDERYALDPAEWEAVTYATRLRAMPMAAAKRLVRRLCQRAAALQPRMVQYKFCSTFDSTPEGNIGPCLDVGLEVFRTPGTVVVPALPVNGRTTYMGYHFVLGVPLAESPMRDHPLNPMTDSNVVRFLQQQTRRRVGLVRHDVVDKRAKDVREALESLWAEQTPYVIVDCLDQRDVRTIAEAVADLPFISGSSGLPMELPAIWRRQGLLGPRRQVRLALRQPVAGTRVLAVSGSCAAQTLRQVAYPHGFDIVRPDLMMVRQQGPRRTAEQVLVAAKAAFDANPRVLVATSQRPEEREACDLDARELGLYIEEMLGEVAGLAVRELGVRHLLVAGGETSGAVCEALGLQAVEILRELAPGVPLCRSVPGRDLVIALKGGNFGQDDFFKTAADVAARVRLT